VDVPGTGAITITSFRGDFIFWKSESGKTGTYSHSSAQVALNNPRD